MTTEVKSRTRATAPPAAQRPTGRGAPRLAQGPRAGTGRPAAAPGRTGSDRTGSDRTGSGRTGSGRTGSGRLAPARPGAPAPGQTAVQRRVTAPGRAALPGRLEGPARATRAAITARSLPVARTPFILLVLGLLGAGLICLLVINTTLDASTFEINKLQHDNITQSQREQELQQQVTSEESPSSIEQRAWQLGMRPQQVLSFLDLRTGHIYTQRSTVPGVTPVAGYTP